MRKSLCSSVPLFMASLAMATAGVSKQMTDRLPFKFQIHHADPWAVKAMLEGSGPSSPELSTLWLLGGANQARTNQAAIGNPLLTDGYLVVNPTDNSLWWYPGKAR